LRPGTAAGERRRSGRVHRWSGRPHRRQPS
jgi:hypothetical protein